MFIPETSRARSCCARCARKIIHGHRIDEHGLVAGLATVEDLVRKLLARVGRDSKQPAPDVVREPDGGLVMRGSMSIDNVEDCLASTLATKRTKQLTTIAGLLRHCLEKSLHPRTR